MPGKRRFGQQEQQKQTSPGLANAARRRLSGLTQAAASGKRSFGGKPQGAGLTGASFAASGNRGLGAAAEAAAKASGVGNGKGNGSNLNSSPVSVPNANTPTSAAAAALAAQAKKKP